MQPEQKTKKYRPIAYSSYATEFYFALLIVRIILLYLIIYILLIKYINVT